MATKFDPDFWHVIDRRSDAYCGRFASKEAAQAFTERAILTHYDILRGDALVAQARLDLPGWPREREFLVSMIGRSLPHSIDLSLSSPINGMLNDGLLTVEDEHGRDVIRLSARGLVIAKKCKALADTEAA